MKPEGVAFLRSRIGDLLRKTEQNAETALWYHTTANWCVFALAGLVAVFSILQRMNLTLKPLAAALVPLFVALFASYGWNVQYKAEFSANRQLSALRDDIDAISAAAAVEKVDLSEDLPEWTKEFKEIMKYHADMYGGSFTPFGVPSGLLGS